VRLAPDGKGLTLTTDDGTTTVDGITARHVFVSLV
jgi:phosphosulfolactate phosphohydrolase-like enzyme